MEDVVKKDILTVLREVVILLEDEEYSEIKELSNHTIHNASIFQDKDSVAAAVIIYSISKIMERSTEKREKIGESIVKVLKDAITLLEKDSVEEYRDSTKKILKIISETDERLQMFIEEVIRQAEIKKGSKLYEHGISAAHAAEILGVSQWEIMNYIGKTTLTEEAAVDVGKRLDFARKLFGS